ncbi:hypothetical protein H0H81_002644 [Sphagnurus paluster]|uniref:DUF676 domain-containing protein n=1 Tax=Sphagnurus paluster TaxID=117069 RepID=A0A9P7GU65_9AGAR|nr:hypothetical protein H0H81_002644 [Sphagnurus paluster]
MPSSTSSQPVIKHTELLLVVFVHGFKGTDQTFGDFPDRLQHILAETTSDVKAECLIFPAYETKGDLTEAVIRFADWLTTLTVEKEVASGGGSGKANIVLCGHSFYLRQGLRADRGLQYLGIHPHVFKNSVTKAAEYASAAQTVGSTIFGAFAGFGAKKAATPARSPAPAAGPTPAAGSGWATAAYAVGGALLAGAAAGSAYYKREEIGTSFTWATDHMKYISNLWDESALTHRVESLMSMEKQAGVAFRVFYTYIPPKPPFSEARMFIVLPKRVSPQFPYFLRANNSLAPDELQAHTGMFGAKTNDGYYGLGLATAKLIRESLQSARQFSSPLANVSDKEKAESRRSLAPSI